MCEIKVIQVTNEESKELMSEVEKIEVNGAELRIIDILGREMSVSGAIKSIDLIKNVVQIT